MRLIHRYAARRLAGLFATGTWTYDYPLTFAGAERLGLKVRSKEVLQLMSLYPQPVRRQPTVEYLPVPRRADRKGAEAEPE
jgi:hypothetical protein